MSGRTSVLRTGRHATCGSPGATSKMRQRNAALHSCAAVQTQLCERGASRHHPRSCARYDFNYESVVPLYRKVYTRCSPAGAWRRPTHFASFCVPSGPPKASTRSLSTAAIPTRRSDSAIQLHDRVGPISARCSVGQLPRHQRVARDARAEEDGGRGGRGAASKAFATHPRHVRFAPRRSTGSRGEGRMVKSRGTGLSTRRRASRSPF